MQLFIEGEMLTGDNQYRCETCNKRVDALKRACIKTLPHMLLLHLKRFEFKVHRVLCLLLILKMDSMKNMKLNDLCEFPERLDMEPYTLEKLERKENDARLHPPWYYQYELVGIVVHQGTADSGHYFSLHREEVSPFSQWFEFNDTIVSKFDSTRIPQECFGGTENVQVWDQTQQKNVSSTRPKISNAYILFYQRVSPPEPSIMKEPISMDKLNRDQSPDDEPFFDDTENSISPYLQPAASPTIRRAVEMENISVLELYNYDKKAPISDDLRQLIRESNAALLLEKHVFNSDYFSFIWDLLSVYSPHHLVPPKSQWKICTYTNILRCFGSRF